MDIVILVGILLLKRKDISITPAPTKKKLLTAIYYKYCITLMIKGNLVISLQAKIKRAWPYISVLLFFS